MSSLQRPFEILVPLRFNDGTPVPEDLITETLLEVERQFGFVSTETQVIRGMWEHEGQSYRDELVRVFVDVPNQRKNREFFVRFKRRLKKRFRQLDLRMTTYLVEEL
jgi:hypothetical protein